MLEASCEVPAEKLARQEARAMEEERARRKRVQWADVEDELLREGRAILRFRLRQKPKTRSWQSNKRKKKK